MTGGWGRRRKQLLDDLKGREDTEKWKKPHHIALSGEMALEEAMNLS